MWSVKSVCVRHRAARAMGQRWSAVAGRQLPAFFSDRKSTLRHGSPIAGLVHDFDAAPPRNRRYCIAWQLASWRLAVVLGAILFFIGFIGVWTETMVALSIVLTALIFAVAIGIPLGILATRSQWLYAVLRPLLDGMQTIPAFVYRS
ncbi:hypothetical protein NKH71_32345 [Mesorhizobium sp. M0983]|uniref:hypothetical protein n=1 Tax=Mesorhizobium sp. M0983 TaxID=2957040 RepID=UPI00333D94E9